MGTDSSSDLAGYLFYPGQKALGLEKDTIPKNKALESNRENDPSRLLASMSTHRAYYLSTLAKWQVLARFGEGSSLSRCGGFSEKDPHRFLCLNTCPQVVLLFGEVTELLGDRAFLGDVLHKGPRASSHFCWVSAFRVCS